MRAGFSARVCGRLAARSDDGSLKLRALRLRGHTRHDPLNWHLLPEATA
jgi:hypothetical protein